MLETTSTGVLSQAAAEAWRGLVEPVPRLPAHRLDFAAWRQCTLKADVSVAKKASKAFPTSKPM